MHILSSAYVLELVRLATMLMYICHLTLPLSYVIILCHLW
jgi:hypothetical protein